MLIYLNILYTNNQHFIKKHHLSWVICVFGT